MADKTKARIRAVVEPAVTGAGFDLEDLKVSPAGRRTLVRVLIDSDTGVDLDAIAEVSRTLSKALDDAEAADGPFTSSSYTLEVSSPGVDRPLKMPRHWRRNVGRLVNVKIGDQDVTGRVAAADEEEVTLTTTDGQHTVAYGELGAGRVQLEFSRSSGTDERQE